MWFSGIFSSEENRQEDLQYYPQHLLSLKLCPWQWTFKYAAQIQFGTSFKPSHIISNNWCYGYDGNYFPYASKQEPLINLSLLCELYGGWFRTADIIFLIFLSQDKEIRSWGLQILCWGLEIGWWDLEIASSNLKLRCQYLQIGIFDKFTWNLEMMIPLSQDDKLEILRFYLKTFMSLISRSWHPVLRSRDAI